MAQMKGTLSQAVSEEIGAASAFGPKFHRIVVTATFTADLLRQPLAFWMNALAIPAEIKFAPYAQVLQELLDQRSASATNASGVNVLLIRLEDWVRDRHDGAEQLAVEHARQAAGELIEAVKILRTRTAAPLLVHLCPSPSSVTESLRRAFDELRRELETSLAALTGVHVSSHAELMRLYPVANHEDLLADRIGHIPYSLEYFAALATLLSRRTAALLKPRIKVIAIDCDNTLWKGICGEDGVRGIQLTPEHVAFQELLVRQHDAGVLLCLCSKNNPEDVDAVFREYPQMPLRPEHLVSSRVNWQPKSTNLRSLADELDLALDSFVLIDDSAIECAEVNANCPQVLTLAFPQSPEEMRHFLAHVWAFDHLVVTADAKRRTAQYQENRTRHQAREQAPNLEQFLATLQLQVDVSRMKSEQIDRVAELIQRTSQFNFTGRRRGRGELEALAKAPDVDILVVHVRDRFGDVGLVGALILKCGPEALEVDTFVLSCRALGRGVEHRIINSLGEFALARGRERIAMSYRTTSRNVPARAFLERTFGAFKRPAEEADLQGAEFLVPVAFAQGLSVGAADTVENDAESERAPGEVKPSGDKTNWHQAAYRLSRMSDLMAHMSRALPKRESAGGHYVAPQTPMQSLVADIWKEVLGLDAIGTNEDFFDLGGDSIQAVQVISRLGAVVGLELPLQAMFEHATVENIARRLESAEEAGEPLQAADSEIPAPLSWSQQRLWFIDQLEGTTRAYHIQLALRLVGQLDAQALQASLDELLERHQALRTNFIKGGAEPIQVIRKLQPFPLRSVDLRESDEARRLAEVHEHARLEATEHFDLSSSLLIRGKRLQMSSTEHVLLITVHHMVADGWSMDVLVRELTDLYAAHRHGQKHSLPELQVQYSDYARWQRKWSGGARQQTQLDYWKEHLRGAPELIDLPADRPRPAQLSYRGSNEEVCVSAEVTLALKGLARRHGLTLAMTLYAAWATFLARVSGQGDLVIGIPVANRRRVELEGLIGYFVNTLAVRVQLDLDHSVADVLSLAKQSLLGAYANQDTPFEQVVKALQPVRRLSHSPLFQVMFVMHSTAQPSREVSDLRVTEVSLPQYTAQFDLSLALREAADGIVGSLNYATDLFDVSTARRFVSYFIKVLEGMARDPATPIRKLPLVSDTEAVLALSRGPSAAISDRQVLHELFEAQVNRTPDALAVHCEGESLTFSQLNARANRLSRYLRAHGVGADQCVALCMERGVEMLVGILGILKAGAAYVPLDPEHPAQRLAYALEDIGASIVLTQERLRARLPMGQAVVVALDGDAGMSQFDASNLQLASSERQLAYVIYTSGSTGRPKGVMVEHRDVMNLWQGLERVYASQPRACARVAMNASYTFDASVQQWVQLLSGRALYVVPQRYRWDAQLLLSYLQEHQIDAIDCTPSQLKMWVSAGLLDAPGHRPQVVLVGGEAIDPALWSRLASSSQPAFYNVYGPTECTVDATIASLHSDTSAPHIGRAMDNRSVYILDEEGELVPIGVKGEIHIGGMGVGRGYLNREELTAQRFVRDPFSTDPQTRMYKSGDLGRWRADGMIDYLGRSDDQVKVRGYRIELGEIEAQLRKCEAVEQSAVIVREDAPGDRRLVGYVTLRAGASEEPSIEAIRSHLKAVLPEYMVPSALVALERWPLTVSGKLDRKSLPAPQSSAYASGQYEAPKTEVERVLAEIWQELLGVERVGRHDNFFQLGGHSLHGMQLIVKLTQRLGVTLSVITVFHHPTISEMAPIVEAARAPQAGEEEFELHIEEGVL